jgi:RNA polymerase sigma-70 factor (ECF subfamily)
MESVGHNQDCFLVREVQGGNQAAFEQLVHAHDQAVLRLALRITGSESDAQDIHQEAFLKVYTKLAGFRFECSLSTWIYRIVSNLCLDHLRRTRNHRENVAIEGKIGAEEYNLLDQLPAAGAAHNPEQQLLGRELGTHISSALQTLTPRERMVFELKHFQGLKLRTVGQILNTSEASIKTSLFRATQKLRLQLAGLTTVKRRSRMRRCNLQP